MPVQVHFSSILCEHEDSPLRRSDIVIRDASAPKFRAK
jgi:hypothetical protein